jgi:hypothetical protein
MNHEKAREYFSAYFEGELENSLKHTFEIQLRNDPVLQADYAAFATTMTEISLMKDEEIEIPIFLSDRIATRIEQEQAKRRTIFPEWTKWVKGLGLAGLSAAAIVGALLSFRSNSGPSLAGIFAPPSAEGLDMSFRAEGRKLYLAFRPSETRTVTISSPISNREVQRFTADANALDRELANPFEGPSILQVTVEKDSAGPTVVVLPGSRTKPAGPGEGTLKDLVGVLASSFREPVIVKNAKLDSHVAWRGFGPNLDEVRLALTDSPQLIVEERISGILTVSQH